MAFIKKVWQNGIGGGTPITKAELDRIELGIDDAHTQKLDKAAAVATTSLRTLGASGLLAQDATTYMQSAAAQVTKGTGVPAVSIDAPGGVYRLTGTVLWDRIAPILAGAGSGNPANHANPGKGTTFVWDGPAGVPMFRVRDSQHVVVKDVMFLGNDTNPPSELFYFENDGSAGQVGTNQMITFERVTFGRYGYASTSYTGYSKVTRCVRFGGTNTNNDQAWFYDCEFGGASDALVAFDNSNTLWCNFTNCLFDGRSMADLVTPTAVGLRTNACVVLVNPQFNRCSKDIDVVNGTAFVYMWNSENSAQYAAVGSSAGLVVHGGAMVAHSTMGTNMFDCTSMGGDGEFSLTDIRFRTGLAAWPKVKVRGGASTLPGRIVVRDCGLPADVYDMQAHATASGGLIVKIDDGDLFIRKHLRNSETLPAIQNMPLRMGGYTSDGSAAAAVSAQLAAAGLAKDVTLSTRATRTNTIANPRFTSSASGWTVSGSASASIVGSTAELTLSSGITAGASIIFSASAAAVAGEVWSAGITVTMTGNTARQQLRLQVNSYASNTICGSQVVGFAPGETKRIYVDGATIAAGDTSARLVLVPIGSTLPSGVKVTVSDPVLEKAPVSGVPFSGASSVPGWVAAWTGTTDASMSTLTPVAAPGTSPDIQVFTSNGTWTKPAGATSVQVTTVAGGSGGGSGRRGAAGTIRCGGGGGGGGGITQRTIAASLCGSTETVVVGAAGTGGAAVTTDSTDGNAGTAGGSSSFGAHAKSNAPGVGGGGTSAAGASGSGGAALFTGGAGGAASATGGTGAVGAVVGAATGGGAGGGITSADVPSAGGNGGTPGSTTRTSSAGAAINTSATPGADSPTNSGEPGGGGGGGGGSITGAAGSGAVGALYGAGGGGGGASLNGNASGAGGNGAAGIVIVTTYF